MKYRPKDLEQLQFHQEIFLSDTKYSKWYSQNKVQLKGDISE